MRLTGLSVLLFGSLLAVSAYAASPSDEPVGSPSADVSQAAEPIVDSDVPSVHDAYYYGLACYENTDEEYDYCVMYYSSEICEEALAPTYASCAALLEDPCT